MSEPPLIDVQLGVGSFFATPVWTGSIGGLDLDSLARRIRRVRNDDPRGRTVSNRGGWQSPDLIGDVTFNEIIDIAKVTTASACEQLGLESAEQIRPRELWANINPPGATNQTHFHLPGNVVSGVIYLEVPPDSGALVLQDPRILHRSNVRPTSVTNEFNTTSVTVTPQPGLVVAFPAWLEHHVEPNLGSGERISMAFNSRP